MSVPGCFNEAMRLRILLGLVAALAAAEVIPRTDVKVAGPIEYGQTSERVRYTGTPKFQAFEFNARPGERIEVTVTAKSGRMQAYLADSEYRTLGGGEGHFSALIPEKAVAGTYYILVMEARRRPAVFTLDLERPSPKR